jgi:glycosyltransferase involved in cell wall biosynthesis
MRKTRILIANDFSLLGTGYGVYGKELLTRLHNTGKYEIAEIGCYTSLDNLKIKDLLWKVYPNAPSSKDPEDQKKKYGSSPANAFGSWRFNQILLHFKPDIVFDMRDYWMYAYQEISPFRQFFRWVVMPTVDSAPQKPEWLDTFSNMDVVIPYTDWAKQTLENQCGNKINLFPDIANAGVDLETFVPPKNKKDLQKEIFGKEVSITGAVMRNQKRKLFPDLFAAYRAYLDKLLSEGKTELYNKSYLYLHTSYPEHAGWDIPSLLIEHKLTDKVYFTSICSKCQAVYPTKFHEPITKCEICDSPTCYLTNATNPAPTAALISIYQTFDFFLQVAICEGFGMPQVEAASCGIPIASVDYSAMTEIVRKLKGYSIPVERLYREMETGADRAYPKINAITEILYDYFVSKSEEDRNSMSKQTRSLCEKYYSWDLVADVWDRAFDTADISCNLAWDSPKREINNDISVPHQKNVVEFIEFIIKEIIREPYLLKTSPIKKLIKDFTNGYSVAMRSHVQSMTPELVVKQLEQYMNGKSIYEAIRQNPTKLFQEPYLNV